jgi:hypothetical protein
MNGLSHKRMRIDLMLRFACFLLIMASPSIGAVITGGYFDLPEGQFELKSSTFDVFGYVDLSNVAIGNSVAPYASGQGPEQLYLPLSGAFGQGTVNGIYYSSLWLNDTSPGSIPPFTLSIPSSFSLRGPTIYGTTMAVTAPFTITGDLNIFTLEGCIECYIPITGTGSTTWAWQYGNTYGGAVATFGFTDPAVVPEPTTCALGSVAVLFILVLGPVRRRLVIRRVKR